MNPGLVVKLRPTGPWRIGPDSGARNRVDVVYHSDSLYAAISSAMARLGSLAEWLDATARENTPAVCFSSCFPFLDEIGFVIPPRTIWPPASAALSASRVRWKSARFVPLGIVQELLAGKTLNGNHWSVDGPSECLVPTGRPGPFRTGIRFNAAVDRLTGSAERHSTACIEFRAGSGLWTIVSFRDETARDRWSGPVQAAFRLLADTGFGGERSRGWGRSETPEFIEGELPDLILPPTPPPAEAGAAAPSVEPPPVSLPDKPAIGGTQIVDPEPEAVAAEEPAPPVSEPEAEGAAGTSGEPESASVAAPSPVEPLTAGGEGESANDTTRLALEPEHAATEPPPVEESPSPDLPPDPEPPPPPITDPPAHEPAPLPETAAPRTREAGHWLLSLFTPAATDAVDWHRGNYTTLARGGRVDSSGELKKLLNMVAEGSVLHADAAPRGAAPDVAPDGFAHPVFRAGFALAIPLPGKSEVS